MSGAALSPEKDQVCLYVEVRCRACLKPGLILTWVNRPGGAQSPIANFMGRRLWRDLTFSCHGCEHVAADLVDVSEPKIRTTIPQRDPYPSLPRALLRVPSRRTARENVA